MSVIEKARELGEEIARSPELAAMATAQQAMLQDSEAKQIIEEFHNRQRTIHMLQSQGVSSLPTVRKPMWRTWRNACWIIR